jgi:hypothetical protein
MVERRIPDARRGSKSEQILGNSGAPGQAAPGRRMVKGMEMEKRAQKIKEALHNNARKEMSFLTIYMMSGVKLSGRI